MNNKIITLKPNERYRDPALEEYLKQREKEWQEAALRDAKHHAKSNLPRPLEDRLGPFITIFKRAFEKLVSEVHQKLQTASQFSDGKMDIDYAEKRGEELKSEIDLLKTENNNDSRQIENFNPKTIPTKIWFIAFISFMIFVGDVALLTNALQILGDTLLFSLSIAITLTLIVLLLAHYTAYYFRKAVSKRSKVMVIALSLVTGIVLFSVLAYLRTLYLKSHGIDASPFPFIIINTVIYIVSILISLTNYPTKEEFNHHKNCMVVYKQILNRNKEIKKLDEEKAGISKYLVEMNKLRAQLIVYAESQVNLIKKMYLETVEVYKNNNLSYRLDRKIPECFHDEIPELEVEDPRKLFLNRKAS